MISKTIISLKDGCAGQSLPAIFFWTVALVIAVGISNPARSELVEAPPAEPVKTPLKKETAYEFNGRITEGYGSEVNADIAQLYRLFGTASDVDQQATAEGESSKVGWLGIGMRVPGQPPIEPDTGTTLQAIEVSGVMPYSAAEAVGLQVGDLIVGLDGALIAGENVGALGEFHRAINTKQPGEQTHLRIFRGEQVLELEATIKSYPHVKSELKPHPDQAAQRAGNDRSLLADALAKEGLTIHFNRLRKVISKETDRSVSLMVRKDDYNPFRLREVNYAMYHPLELPMVARNSITDRLSGTFSQSEHDLNGLIQTALDELDMRYRPVKANGKISPIGFAGDFTGYIERLVTAIQHAKQVRAEVLSVLDPDEIDYLYQIVPGLLGSNLEQLEMEKNKDGGEEDKAQQEARTKLEKQQYGEL
ncbi:MAG: PDZ domain-containing protein, partial [Gallionella sp.]